MEEILERHIQFEGALNFRDLGGYRTQEGRRLRWRRLFRSDKLHLMTDEDIVQARDNLGIRTVIDLREPESVERDGVERLIQPPIKYHHKPIVAGPKVWDMVKSSPNLGLPYFENLEQTKSAEILWMPCA